MSKISDAVQSVRNEFLQQHRDLLAFTKEGADGVMLRVVAALALDKQAKEDVQFYTSTMDQSGYAGEVALADFKRELHRSIARAFLECQHNFVIEFVARRLTPEAVEQLENIEITAGVRAPRPVVSPPPCPKSAQEQLEDQVIEDYNGALSADKMRKKVNSDVAYRETFNRLSNAGKLQSQVTTLHDFSKVSVGS